MDAVFDEPRLDDGRADFFAPCLVVAGRFPGAGERDFGAAPFATGVRGRAAADGVAAECVAAAGFAVGGGEWGAVTTGGFGGVRELEVFSGGKGCLRGRPLFRAACPSAISLSNAAFASARSRACCELRALVARSFSARNRSSGLECFISCFGKSVRRASILSQRKRASENGSRSIQARPSSTSCSTISPIALANLNPCPEHGLTRSTRPLASPAQSMMKWRSGVLV